MTNLIPDATWPQIRAVLEDPTIQVGLFGPPGVGKTHALFAMAQQPPQDHPLTTHALVAPAPTERRRSRKKAQAQEQAEAVTPEPIPTRYVGKIQFHSEMSPADAMGMHVPADGGYVWDPGAADLAYSHGGLLILDEIDQASGPMKSYLMGLLDRGPGGTITYIGRTFVQQPGYQAVATMNDRPDQGALPEALLDRFDAWFLVTQPSAEQLAILDEDLRDICLDSYLAATDPLRGPDITFRLLHGLQKLRKRMPLEQAVLGACKSNKTLAESLLEVLALTSKE